MKKHKIMVDLLAVANMCIEASEAHARLLESRGKGPSKKKQDDQEVNTTDRGDPGDYRDHRDHGYRGNRQNNPHIRRRNDRSITLLTQRSGARSIIP
jgi:hypothetical protein